MNILLTHGYLLKGTGSNLYVANLVKEMCADGHNVFLVCQEYNPMDLDFVEDLYNFNLDNTVAEHIAHQETPYKGKCKCFIPNLNGFLPVYVYDHYDGFTVKEFPNCTDQEVQNYIDYNVTALNVILKTYSEITVLQTNHTVMFPYIATQVDNFDNYKHYMTVHGSALNFTVKKDKRFVEYARVGLEGSDEILVDSKHAEVELLAFLDDYNYQHLKERVLIIPAGVDVENFLLLEEGKKESIQHFVDAIQERLKDNKGRTKEISQKLLGIDFPNDVSEVEKIVKSVREGYDYRHTDIDIDVKIKTIDSENERIVLFIGKYLWTKGIYLILLAIPQILKENPSTRFVFVGFGPFREVAEVILNCLATKNITLLKRLVKESSLFHYEENTPYPLIAEILDVHGAEIQKTVEQLDINILDKVIFTGIVEHKQLKYLLPCADVLIAPSVFPEAFGMVAIEAMACGVSPTLTYQSAFLEISDEVKESIKQFPIDLYNVTLDENASKHIGLNVSNYLSLQEKLIQDGKLIEYKNTLRNVVVQNYSWKGIMKSYIQTYQL